MNSNPDRYKRVKALCNEALDLALSERSAFLDGACAGDGRLRREVESLLSHEESVAAFMIKPAWQHVVKDMTEMQREWLAGRQLGRYRIHERLGQGGMGEVWRATDPQLKRDVAVKVMQRDSFRDPLPDRRRHPQAYAVSALKHPNIVTIYEVGEHRQLHF